LTRFPFFRSVSGFQKSFKSSVWWSVSSFLGPVIPFLGLFSGFQEKFYVLILLIGFLFFGSIFSFLVHFLFFGVHFRFSKKVLNSQFVDRFPLIFGPVSSFFGSVSGFQKKFLILNLLIGFLFFGARFLIFWVCFRFSGKVVKFPVCWSVSSFSLTRFLIFKVSCCLITFKFSVSTFFLSYWKFLSNEKHVKSQKINEKNIKYVL